MKILAHIAFHYQAFKPVIRPRIACSSKMNSKFMPITAVIMVQVNYLKVFIGKSIISKMLCTHGAIGITDAKKEKLM